MRIMSLYLNSEIVNSEIVHLYSLDQTVFSSAHLHATRVV